MTTLTIRQDAWIDVRGAIGLTGWQPPEDLKVEEWSDVMRKAGAVNRMAGWIIGDGLVASDARWGEMVAEASVLTGLQPETLSAMKWVARSVPIILRKERLSFSHHKEIARFDAERQTYWLTEAERNNWSVRDLREAIAKSQEPESKIDEDDWEDDAPTFKGGFAYCKYCYETHDNWEYDGESWGCGKCNHCTADENMEPRDKPEPLELEDDEEQDETSEPPDRSKTHITLEEWNAGERLSIIRSNATFNQTNDNIEWAAWSWNPITGCLHNCNYCYARDIANRFYPYGFQPAFIPERLDAPTNMKQGGPRWADDIGHRNVFTCSMADLFGKWVPVEWIDAVIDTAANNPQWTFLFLTKFPIRMSEFRYPSNVWLGTTVDKQYAVTRAESAFRRIKASGFDGVCWLSCEPMLERLTFSSLSMFDWVVMGGASKSTQTPEMRPPFDDVVHLYQQARNAKCKVYMKTNLGIEQRIREYPS